MYMYKHTKKCNFYTLFFNFGTYCIIKYKKMDFSKKKEKVNASLIVYL